MHRLLKRQIERYFSEGKLPEGSDWKNFIEAIDEAYVQADTDRHRLERMVELNSQELLALNSQMKAAIPDTFLRLDKQAMILDYEPGKDAHDYLTNGWVVGKPLSRFLPEAVCQKYLDAITQIANNNAPEVTIVHRIVESAAVEDPCPDADAATVSDSLSEDGQKVYVYEVRVLPLIDFQVVAIVRDITQRKQAEAALKRSRHKLREKTHRLATTLADLKDAQAQLVQTEKMSSLGQLVAGIAHEINNPINFVSGNIKHISSHVSELLDLLALYQECYPNPKEEIETRIEDVDLEFMLDDLNKIQTSMKLGVDRIKEIVLSLRVFSRLDEADMKEVNIHEGIESTLLILNHRFKQADSLSRVTLQKNYGNLPQVECYAGQLNQVFMNILANGLDALEDNRQDPSAPEPTITITTELIEENTVCIRISNNGPNIPYDIRDKLFDPFFTTKTIGKGTGLGLSISYQIITDRHGGKMRCYSLPGQNTEFCIEIPVHQPKEEGPLIKKSSVLPHLDITMATAQSKD